MIAFMVLAFSSGAQDLSIHMLDSVYARTAVNPAYRFDKKIVVNLLGFTTGIYTNGIGLGDILQENGGFNQFNLKEGIGEVNESNYVMGEANLQLIGLGITFGRWQFSVGYDWHFIGANNYSRDLFLLLANGNAPYIGETLAVGPDLLLQGYHDLHIGASYQMKNVSVGARIKLLSGVNDMSTDRSSLQVTTDDEIYQLIIDSDYILNTTGIVEYDGIQNVDIDGDSFRFENFLGSNNGIGIDLGVDWSVTYKLNLSASILDIGSIDWLDDVVNYTSNMSNSFEGVDILDYIDDDEEVILEDSLYNLLDFTETNDSYSTSLGAKYHISARYKTNNKLTFGASYYLANNNINSRYMISANTQYKVFPWLSLGSGLASTSNSTFLIPFNTMLHLGPVSMYMSSDNILSGFSITCRKVSQIRLGLHLGF